jgi:phosphatidylglycerol:prolipoprotein diacylglycerol transferase
MVHHPLVAALGGLVAAAVSLAYVLVHRLPYRLSADVLAAPLALGLAFEQVGALLSGSGYGTGTAVPWAVVYTDPLAARWSDAPLGIPVHPVQAYAAIGLLLIAAGVLLCVKHRVQNGDLAGLSLVSCGVLLYLTELWRDPVGRGALLRGFLKGPQAAGLGLILGGAAMLLESPSQRIEDLTTNAGAPIRAAEDVNHG